MACFSPACDCSTSNPVCEVTGGQCPCDSAPSGLATPTGRQCNQCPLTSFLTTSGCSGRWSIRLLGTALMQNSILLECSCPAEAGTCALTTGQCLACPDFAFGLMCEQCVTNSYRANDSCLVSFYLSLSLSPVITFHLQACDCSEVGTVFCNGTNGQCICQEGVAGARCDQCLEGFYNFSTSGCTACNCGPGTISDSCNSNGICTCHVSSRHETC